MPSTCGCTLLDGAGNPVTWADQALSLAQTEIHDNGFQANRDSLLNELCLSEHFKVGSPSMQDDEVTWQQTMDLLNPYIEAPEFKETHATSTQTFSPGRCYNTAEVSALISSDTHTACSPRAVMMLASGTEEFRGGMQYIVIEDAVQCIDSYRGKRKGQFAAYLREMVKAFPKAALRIREWNMFVTMFNNGWNTAETGDLGLNYSLGSIPNVPDAVFSISSAKLFAQHLRDNDFTAAKTWHIDERVLHSLLLHRQFNGAAGFQLQATTFMGPQMPEYTVGSTVNVDGVTFKVCDLPFGYIKQTGTSAREFIPIDRRKWQAVQKGVRAFGDSRYQGSSFTDDNGVRHKLISPIWAADPSAYLIRPYGRDANTPVTSGAEAWSLSSQVQFIGDAYLPCNEDRNKFKPRLKQAWKMDPQQPRATAVAWSRLPGPERIANRIGLDDVTLTPVVPIEVNKGCVVTGLTCAEAVICSEPAAALPQAVGTFHTECAVTVAKGVTTLKIAVTRKVPAGYAADGAASLAYATANGTATSGAGNDYTAASGTLSWADEECGVKTITITILTATATPGSAFVVNYSSATGATMAAGACTSTAVTLAAE